jgi:hypothetical protein
MPAQSHTRRAPRRFAAELRHNRELAIYLGQLLLVETATLIQSVAIGWRV